MLEYSLYIKRGRQWAKLATSSDLIYLLAMRWDAMQTGSSVAMLPKGVYPDQIAQLTVNNHKITSF